MPAACSTSANVSSLINRFARLNRPIHFDITGAFDPGAAVLLFVLSGMSPMRRLLRSAFVAAGLGTFAPVAFAQPAAPPPSAEPNPPGLPLTHLPAFEPDAGARKVAPPPLDAAASKPPARTPADVALPKPPVVTYTLPAIPPLPNTTPPRAPGLGVDVARPKVAPRSPAALASQPPGTLPAFPDTASAGTRPAPPAVAAAPTVATSAAPCGGLCEAVSDPVWRLFPQDGRVRVSGFLNGGYVYNSSNPDSKFNGPYNSIDRSAEPMFNQGYAAIESRLPTDGSWGVGGRIDLLFGYDHFRAQSRGLEIDRDGGERWNGQYYGLAIPQAYLETGDDATNFKLGHFYSTVGYETLPAANNFFYSRAYSFQFGQPITQWGGVLTSQLTKNVQVHAGLANSWDTLVGRENDLNLIAGIKYTPDSHSWWTSFALVSGENGNNPAGLPGIANAPGNRTRYSFLLGVTPGGPCGRWEYVFHHYYGWQENGTAQGNFARWYGIDQYLYYRVSDRWKAGVRAEWFRDEDGTRVGLNRASNPNNPPLPGNYFSLTGGVNYAPTANFTVRPEVRWDFTSDTARPAFNDGRKNNQLLLGCDLIWKY